MTRRKAIHVDGVRHKNPIPPASRIGSFVATGVVSGRDKDRKVSPDATEQARAMFENLERVLNAAGASFDDILKLNVWIAEESIREHLNVAWLETSRSRHASRAPGDDLRASDGGPAHDLRRPGGGEPIIRFRQVTTVRTRGARWR